MLSPTMLPLLLLLLTYPPPTTSNKHIPFGYQSNSATSPIARHETHRDPSSFAGAIHYDPLHHALYMTGVTYSDTFDGSDLFNLQHEEKGWDIGVKDSNYTPKNGDCFYSVFKLPVDRQPFQFQPGNAIQGGVSLMHSRRFGSRTSSESCSAVDILPPSVNEDGLGGLMYDFDNVAIQDSVVFSPTVSPQPSSSTYFPTYLPSVTGRPTYKRGVVPEEVDVLVDPNELVEDIVKEGREFTKSNVASKVKIYHNTNPSGIISLKEVQVYDAVFTDVNIALNRPALQSSDYNANTGASKAVDGDLDTFSHTQINGQNEYWEVDFDGPMTIGRVVVINRDCKATDCLGRLSYATMDLIDENGNVVARRQFSDTTGIPQIEFSFAMPSAVPEGPVPTYSPTYLPSVTGRPTPEQPSAGLDNTSDQVNISRVARKVRIQLPESTGEGQLGIREVEVYDENTVNVAVGKPATQSSTWSDMHVASYGNDGDSTTSSDTMNEVMAWWEVDLEQMTTITSIIIYNRWCKKDDAADTCLGRMSYATVSLIDDTGFVVATRNVGDMSAEESISFDFSDFEPSVPAPDPAFAPSVPASDPAFAPSDATPTGNDSTYSPTYLPSVTGRPTPEQPSAGAVDIPPDATPTGNDSTYSPTYLPSVTGRPTPEQPTAGLDDSTTSHSSSFWMAQKVRIELLGTEDGGPLSLVQVEVNEVTGMPSNRAAGQMASQSTTLDGYSADNAVNLDMTDYSHTDLSDVNAWWEVDLGAMYGIEEIVITLNPSYCGTSAMSYSIVTLLDNFGMGVAELNIGDVSDKESITLTPADAPFDVSMIPNDGLNPRRLGATNTSVKRELQPPIGAKMPAISAMKSRSVRLLVAGHVESTHYDDGYIVSDLVDGQYDQANVYGFTQQVDIRLPLGALKDEPDFMNDLEIMNNPNANINGLEYSLEEESLGGFVTSGIDAKALLNDHLPVTLNTLYPVALVSDTTSKLHYYVMILAADNAELNDEGHADSELNQDTTVGSGANQQSWTDFDSFGVPGIINPQDLFGKKGRPKFGSDYRILLKKMEISTVDPSCVIQARRGERRTQSDGCKLFSAVEKSLSSTSYDRDTVVHSQKWVQEFEPDLGEDTRPAGLIFAPSNDANSPDLLVMGGSTSGYGVAFGTTQDTASEGQSPERIDLDGFVMKIRADNGSFAGKDAFDAATNSFTNTHSLRISSLPNKHDLVASLCSDPLREWGTPEPQDHVYVVGSTEGLLPGMTSGLRDSTFVSQYPEETAVNSMEAFLMKVDLATMNPIWTVQVAGVNLVSNIKGHAYGFGCAVTHDSENVYLTGMVKDGGVVTDFSADSLKRHDNAARGGTDVFVASYKTSDGTLNFLRQIGSTKDDMPSRGNGGITVDRIGNPIVVGNTRGSLMRKRDVMEYMFGGSEDVAASDVFIMSLERDTGEYAPISEDSQTPVIPVDNSGVTESTYVGGTDAASQEKATPTEPGSSAASIFLFVVLVLLLVGAVMGSGMFIYKTRKLEQRRKKELHGNHNISPYGRKRNSRGLQGKAGGSVLNQFEDMNIMVEVRNSASGGWHGVYDDEAIQQIDFLGSSRGGQDDVIEQSLFMEDGLQQLEEIENKHNSTYSIGDDEDEEEVTDEDLIQAYNEAMAIDIEPESDAVAALTRDFNMPNLGSDHHEIT